MNDDKHKLEFKKAIRRDDIETMRKLIELGFVFRDYISNDGGKLDETFLSFAAQNGSEKAVRFLLEIGAKPDAAERGSGATALSRSVDFDKYECAELLCKAGANPNLGRATVSAVSHDKSPEDQLRFLKLLIDHGANLNELFDLYGDKENAFTVLDFATKEEVVAFLRSHGALTAEEVKAAKPTNQEKSTAKKESTGLNEVEAYFQQSFGELNKRSWQETLPSANPIAIRWIPPTNDRKVATFFTNGLSNTPMKTPAGREDFAIAELFIQLPSECVDDGGVLDQYKWILRWMHDISKFPAQKNSWLGGPVTTLANDSPPKPLSKSFPFTCWLLIADKDFVRKDGRTVQLFRMLPIYTSEREFERKNGTAALMKLFDKKSVPWIVDFRRDPVV